jgi:hypothetical protein
MLRPSRWFTKCTYILSPSSARALSKLAELHIYYICSSANMLIYAAAPDATGRFGSLLEDLVDLPLAFARFETPALLLALADCVLSFLLPSASFDWGRETVGEPESLPCLRGAACMKTGADPVGFTPGRATCGVVARGALSIILCLRESTNSTPSARPGCFFMNRTTAFRCLAFSSSSTRSLFCSSNCSVLSRRLW